MYLPGRQTGPAVEEMGEAAEAGLPLPALSPRRSSGRRGRRDPPGRCSAGKALPPVPRSASPARRSCRNARRVRPPPCSWDS